MGGGAAPVLPLRISPEVGAALADGGAVVALETTVVAHGLPPPHGLEAAAAMAGAVRAAGAVPAVIGVIGGRVRVGLDDAALARLAGGAAAKASARDLPHLIATGGDGATTVAGTLACAAAAGIAVLATGGIGGVHRGGGPPDVSADLGELRRSRVAVVSSGPKTVLDLPATVERLETEGVPVVGFRTARWPAFYCVDGGLALPASVDDEATAAAVVAAARGLGRGVLIANPPPAHAALGAAQVEAWVSRAEREAGRAGVTGAALTPFLLRRLAELSEGRTLAVNRALLEANAGLAGRIARALAAL